MPSNNGALVVHDPNQGRQGRRPQGQRRQDGRRGGPRPNQGGRGRRPPNRDPNWEDPDNVSDVSDAEYDNDYEEPRFKYSTAELRNAGCLRNQSCCIAAMIILCIAIAIIVSVVYKKVESDRNESNDTVYADVPTIAPVSSPPTFSAAPSLPGRFLRSEMF